MSHCPGATHHQRVASQNLRLAGRCSNELHVDCQVPVGEHQHVPPKSLGLNLRSRQPQCHKLRDLPGNRSAKSLGIAGCRKVSACGLGPQLTSRQLQ